MNLMEKIAVVRAGIGGVLKKSEDGYGYTYTPEQDILMSINKTMAEQHLTLYPSIVPQTMVVTPYSYKKTKYDKINKKFYEETCNEILVQADMVFTWIDNDNPEDRLEVPFALVGQQSDASQCFGSGLTYVNRYFLLKFFNIATTNDDPDKLKAEQARRAAESKNRELREIIDQIDALVNSKTTDSNKAEIRKICEMAIDKTGKDGKPDANYKKIKDINRATTLLKTLNDFFGGNE